MSGMQQKHNCKRHGLVAHLWYQRSPTRGFWRCLSCRNDAVSKSRITKKIKLVQELGGKCLLCGYDKCIRALHFHHIDPKQKCFGLSEPAYRTASLKRARIEAQKCILVCANCHAEIEAGVRTF
jgi:hypothetical protein